VRPGATHDITAARELVLAALLPHLKDLPVLADCGYDGAAHGIYTPVKKRTDGVEHDPDTRTYNKLLRGLRCLGERGFALLTRRWKSLQHVTMSPERIGDLARAALVLTQFEHKMLGQ
jgi:transposase